MTWCFPEMMSYRASPLFSTVSWEQEVWCLRWKESQSLTCEGSHLQNKALLWQNKKNTFCFDLNRWNVQLCLLRVIFSVNFFIKDPSFVPQGSEHCESGWDVPLHRNGLWYNAVSHRERKGQNLRVYCYIFTLSIFYICRWGQRELQRCNL